MAIIKLNFINVLTGVAMDDAQLDDSMTPVEALAFLRESNFPLPPLREGERHVLQLKQAGGQVELNDTNTLAENGVTNGATLKVAAAAAGGHACP